MKLRAWKSHTWIAVFLLTFSTLAVPARADDEPVVAPLPAGYGDAVDILFFGSGHPYLLRVHLRVDGQSFRQVWRLHAVKFFQQLDLNGDGTLDRNEAQRIDAQSMLPEQSFFDKLYAAATGSKTTQSPADISKADGEVTQEEFLAYLKRNRRGPFQANPNPNVNRNVYIAYIKQTTANLFGQLDANGDKKLSQNELDAAVTVLRSLDTDDDELVTLNELNAAAMRNANRGVSYIDTATDGQKTFVVISPQAKLDSLVRRLWRTYAPKDKSTNEDDDGTAPAPPRYLKQAALGWTAELFARFDTNSDGRLENAELQKYLRDPIPALELIVRRGKKEPSQKRIEVVRSQTAAAPRLSVRSRGRDALTIDFGRDRLGLHATGNSPVNSSTRLFEQQFAAIDRDANGYLEKKEVRRNYYFENSFRMMDADGDGKLFKQEMTVWLDRQNESAYSRTLLSVTNRGRNLLDVVDADQDRRLSLRELRNIAALTAAFDANRDKAIEPDELPGQYQLMFAPAQPTIHRVAVAAPTFAVGTLANRQSRQAPRWFQKMDINNDGDISLREFLGPREHFGRLDADGDGLIDAKEAAQFD
jgi:Ca2+-binding EF-hand superfamily protein